MSADDQSSAPRPRPRPYRPADAARPLNAEPRRRRRLSGKTAAGIGVGLFIMATVASALAGPGKTPGTATSSAAADGRTNGVVPALALASSTPAAAPLRTVKKGRQAPATKAVIDGLAANGIPKVALNAYRVAAARLAAAEPSCGIGWWLLAGIGRVESDHGRFGGATLHADGTSTPKIIGPALTGRGNEYIPAPPNGAALAGDSVYTHALGPMQFIPQTWDSYGIDGNGDHVTDIFNINDAALAAARYLCAAGGNLRTAAGQQAAILAYNHSTEYLAQVLALADAYRTGVPVSGRPVGRTTGPLPPVQHSGPLPPVNPGPPTAVSSSKSRRTAAARTGSTPAGTGAGGGGTRTAGGRGGGSGAVQQPAPAPKPSTTKPLLPLPSLSLPTKSRASKTPTPTPTPTKTCILNALGLCIG
jgi:membrane-bound lytic murein transglycosylase B